LALIEAGDEAAAGELLAAALEDFPGDEEARFLYARVLAWNGQRAQSLDQFDLLLRSSPDNADYLLAKARVLYWDGRYDDSLLLLGRARELQPDYQSVWQLESRVLMARGGENSRSRFAQLTADGRSRWPDDDWPTWEPAPVAGIPPSLGYLEAGLGFQDLSDGLDDWSSLYVSGARSLGGRSRIYGGIAREERFAQADTELRAGLVWPVGSKGTLTAEASLAPGADVLPRWSLFSALQYPLGRGYGLGVGLRHASYATTSLNVLTLVGDKYFGDFHASWTVYLSKLKGADATFANQFRMDRYYREDNRIGLLIAAGRETESVGQGQFIENDTFSVVVTGLHEFTPVWSLSWDVIFQDRDEAYRRGGFRLGLRRQF
jgi:YaiO family outer membrane protein